MLITPASLPPLPAALTWKLELCPCARQIERLAPRGGCMTKNGDDRRKLAIVLLRPSPQFEHPRATNCVLYSTSVSCCQSECNAFSEIIPLLSEKWEKKPAVGPGLVITPPFDQPSFSLSQVQDDDGNGRGEQMCIIMLLLSADFDAFDVGGGDKLDQDGGNSLARGRSLHFRRRGM